MQMSWARVRDVEGEPILAVGSIVRGHNRVYGRVRGFGRARQSTLFLG